MLLTLLLPVTTLAPAPAESSLLATVPESAYVLVHCRDVAALRERAELNDWYRLLGSTHGEPLWDAWARELQREARSDLNELAALGRRLEGEVVFFDTGTVAGFVTDAPADRGALVESMRSWMPDGTDGNGAARRTLELAGGAVELAAWPDEIDGWTGRAGHFAAFVDHPRALALYSGDDSAAVLAAVTEGFAGLGSAPVVESYLAAGGGLGGGIELYVDFTPLVGDAEAALKQAVDGVLPDPSSLLGLEQGTWFHASADLFPGTLVDCRGMLHLPADTLASELADTFEPLPRTLPADLPRGVWNLWAWNWDIKSFYARARAAFEEAGRGEGLASIDAAVAAAEDMSEVNVILDVLNQLAGDFAVYYVEPLDGESDDRFLELEALRTLGLHAGLIDGDDFLAVLEKLMDVGGASAFLELEEIAGADAYVITDEDDFDGGAGILPRALAAAPTRRVLELGLRALARVDGASLEHGSSLMATIDANAGACFLSCVELTPLRAYWLPQLEGDLLPPLGDGPARDPFDSQLIGTARRTPAGFELWLHTR